MLFTVQCCKLSKLFQGSALVLIFEVFVFKQLWEMLSLCICCKLTQLSESFRFEDKNDYIV